MSLPEPLRRRLGSFSRSVFTDSHGAGGPRRPAQHADQGAREATEGTPAGSPVETAELPRGLERLCEEERLRALGLLSLQKSSPRGDLSTAQQELKGGGNEILSSLPLQMALYFNVYYFPFWWLSTVVMLCLKYQALPDYCKFILVTVVLLGSLIEAIRLYLGYMGNLQEKVPELAGFWLLSLLLQLPLILFLLFHEDLKNQPLERALHAIFALFLIFQVLTTFVTLKKMVNKLTAHFRLVEFDLLEEQPGPAPSSLGRASRAAPLGGRGPSAGWASQT